MYRSIIEESKIDAPKYLESNFSKLTCDPKTDDIGIVLALLLSSATLNEITVFKKLANYIHEFESFEDDLEAKHYYFRAYGMNYREVMLFEQALPYYEQANKISYILNDKLLIASSLLALASFYLYVEDNDMALHYGELAMKEARNSNSLLSIGDVYSIIGVIYLRAKNPEKALESNLEALSFYKQNERYLKTRNYIITLINIGVSYVYNKKTEKAKAYLDKALELSVKLNYKILIGETYKAYVVLYEELNQWEKTCENYKKYVEILKGRRNKGNAFEKSHDKVLLKSRIVSMSNIKEKNDDLISKIDVLYDEFHELSFKSSKKLQAINEVKEALKRGDIITYFQGKHYISEGKINGAEALVRMRNVKGDIVSPVCFIEYVDNHNIINEISKKVIKDSISLCEQETASGNNDFIVSINLSPYQLSNPEIIPFLEDEIVKSKIKPNNIEIELTERALIEKNPTAMKCIKRIKDFGIGISLDDFGAGYSSLSSLKDFPFDVVKIDRSLVFELPEDKKAYKLLYSLTRMLKDMDYKVVVEGVETKEQVSIIDKFGCDVIQGFYFAKPIPYDEFIKK